jgi:surface antigen
LIFQLHYNKLKRIHGHGECQMKMPTKLCNIFIAVSLLSSLGGCSSTSLSDFNKEDIGTAIGAVGGGILCYAMLAKASNANRAVGTTACAVGGGFLGNHIGKTLDEKDRAELALQTQSALNSSASGVTTWKSSTTGATAKIDVSKAYTKSESVDVKRNVAVQPVAKMTKLNAPYIAVKGANVRSSPSTKGEKLASLPAMTEFTALGQAGDWIAVGHKGVSVGYVSADLVESKAKFEAKLAAKVAPKSTPAAVAAVPAPAPAPAPIPTPTEAKAAAPSTEVAEVHYSKPVFVPALKFDEVTAANEPQLAKLVEQPVVAEKVESEVTCKTVKSTVTDAKGAVEPSTSELCKKPAEDAWSNA